MDTKTAAKATNNKGKAGYCSHRRRSKKRRDVVAIYGQDLNEYLASILDQYPRIKAKVRAYKASRGVSQ